MIEAEELVVDVLDERVIQEEEGEGVEVLDISYLADGDLSAILAEGGLNDIARGQAGHYRGKSGSARKRASASQKRTAV